MESILVILVVAAIVALAVRYIYKAKKRGVKCVGCPGSGSCCTCNCGCTSEKT